MFNISGGSLASPSGGTHVRKTHPKTKTNAKVLIPLDTTELRARTKFNTGKPFIFRFDPREMVPAPAQGVLVFQACTDDVPTRRILNKIHDREVAEIIRIERTVLKLLDGGCQMPLGVYCQKDPIGNFHVWATQASGWDQSVKRVNISSSTSFELAERVVEALRTE